MNKNDKETLRAGAALVDITPRPGTHLSGSGCGEHRPAQSILDPLFAKAIVFEVGDRRLCIVTLDVTIITGDFTQKIRTAIAEKTGVALDAIMIHGIQTHSAPIVLVILCWIRTSLWRRHPKRNTCGGPKVRTAQPAIGGTR